MFLIKILRTIKTKIQVHTQKYRYYHYSLNIEFSTILINLHHLNTQQHSTNLLYEKICESPFFIVTYFTGRRYRKRLLLLSTYLCC